ncbi:MAG: FAD-binding protein, partial [Caulobacteraceae bacterium]
MLGRFEERLDGAFGEVDQARLARRLRGVLGEGGLIEKREGLAPFSCDGLAAYRGLPRLVALPRTAEEAAGVLGVCAKMEVPVVARGAGTGLSGGALPFPGSVLLTLTRMDQILEIDPEAMRARVQPGARNLEISAAAAPFGLFYAPDPSSQLACSIGGNVAENAGGVHCLKYGLTVHNLAALEIITIDGERMRIGGEALDSPGFDLLALLTGSEGLLAVIVEASLKLLPIAEAPRALLAAFGAVARAGEAVARIIAAGIVPAGLEMMDQLAVRAAEAHCAAGYPTDAAAILLCELDGAPADVAGEIAEVEAICRGCG